MDPRVDRYLKTVRKWGKESQKLRAIALSCGLTEEFKWGKPCYMFEKSNIVIIQSFSLYCAFLFFKGVLLKDPHHILQKTGKNTRVGRQARFYSLGQITAKRAALRACLQEAIEVEKQGLKVQAAKKADVKVPKELRKKMKHSTEFKSAFGSLTPGRQRGYIYYFTSPKLSTTRESRIEKFEQKILKGKGLNEK